MEESLIIAVGTALWLGILTSISPCPLATNIAAISYVSKRVKRPSLVLLAGLLYTLGRTLSYFIVALLVVKSLFSVPAISRFLQQNMNQALGPVLLLVGVMLLDVIPWPWVGGSAMPAKLQTYVDKIGLWGAGLLGLVFALAFCPLSAALFFGSLVPLAVAHESAVLLPGLYGIGTALPVVVFSLILAFAAGKLGKAFDVLSHLERWMRRLTAAVFIGIGGYYVWMYWIA
ncbi:MAG: aromatic aminobenezylarsenical efflux permease ArsG family transporter [Myxococcota bacterium]|jgi:cytochrome c biogenesis protein CcdA|nr:aromatic aminobenezylarsenical efflux permease ArsG family transporter [Myxococcota bacterium]